MDVGGGVDGEQPLAQVVDLRGGAMTRCGGDTTSAPSRTAASNCGSPDAGYRRCAVVASPMAEPLGLESGIVGLLEYDARWPVLFAAEEQRIRDRCRALPLTLEHIGSTSIPGMCAKPVLDILAGRAAGAAIADYVTALAAAGYVHRGERGIPGREFFRRGEPRAYHVHLVEEGGPLWREYLGFRDYLRTHDDAARRFADVKRGLAARFSTDREAYITAKSPHVLEILRRAGVGPSVRND